MSLSFLKQDTEQENMAKLSRVTAFEMCTLHPTPFTANKLLKFCHYVFQFPAAAMTFSLKSTFLYHTTYQ